ncbi:major facilitator superfamily protein [Thermincola ferriacetica]|uniref:Major facilitator superfamily protein n=1 Tax=Thermincola ferriacetica TaxID=281456 RepID=A0A0L6W608_9FIRM|nr:MFS transporter [Thermincola ferriacetica]KNZ70823.1 major facilitator superfamily protein [Thermincola ferriacetica]
MKGNKIATILALGGVPFVMVLGNSMLIPVLPKIKSVLQISQFKVSLIITLFSIPAGIIIPLAGFLSDRLGRKTVIIPSLLIYGIGGVIAGLAAVLMKNPFTALLAGRVIQGIGAAGTAPVAMALAGDIFTNQQRGKALGSIEAANGLGKVVSPILGSLIGLIAWYATFWVFPILTVPVAAAIWLTVKEPKVAKRQENVANYISSLKNIFSNKAGLLLTSFFAGSLALLVLFGILFYLSDFLENTHKIFAVKKGFILAIPVLAMSSTSLITGSFIQKKVKLMKILTAAGLLILGASLGILPYLKNIYLFVGGIAVAGIGVGLVLPCLNTLITSACTIDERGMVTSLYGGVRFIGVAIGPPLFGWMMDISTLFMFWAPAVTAFIAAVLTIVFLPGKEKKETDTKNLKSIQANMAGLTPARKTLPRRENKTKG